MKIDIDEKVLTEEVTKKDVGKFLLWIFGAICFLVVMHAVITALRPPEELRCPYGGEGLIANVDTCPTPPYTCPDGTIAVNASEARLCRKNFCGDGVCLIGVSEEFYADVNTHKYWHDYTEDCESCPKDCGECTK